MVEDVVARNGTRKAHQAVHRRATAVATPASQPLWDDAWIVSGLETVRSIIADAVASTRGTVGAGLRNLTSRGGKMLRPGLVIVGSAVGGRGVSGIPQRILKLAAGVEMLHLATLVHDDVVDDSATRRGAATMHQLYGTKTAVLMGDMLFAQCFELVADGSSMKNARYLAGLVKHVCAGEIDELDQSGKPIAGLRAYRRRVTGKTGLLIALSAYVGASERKREREVQRRLLRAGFSAGMAFQIVDDILDYESDEARMGKPVGADLQAGVYTLPAILALRRRPEIAPLLSPPVANVERAVVAVNEAGGLAGAKAVAAQYTERAFREIQRLPNGPATEALGRTVSRLLVRDR